MTIIGTLGKHGLAPVTLSKVKFLFLSLDQLFLVNSRKQMLHSNASSNIHQIGKGSFGHVQLVKDKTGKTYALKSVNKAQIVRLGQQKHIISEKR